ncbi:tripartite tricarboxylate transporter substrate binding protein [Candidimonas humi]|jgi:tripartite-type tricarboxylate transporter receptor subunit TctC|uniref:Bug family tripartite tricarboxylate transporter substrate binding protein n=1 Tax=Candidimonas humi TaxID=683355 RepID=A0ABV8NX36_9BURK|nr:tripartite tricarboxylate transporter substrate binding protein [Candidimonas humi]MBV6304770.1 tripartite tricarboxylate transporter substrate binding protein [Candidimonas humi]
MKKIHRISSLLSAAALGLACSLPAHAATAYPDKPIHLIVPFAAGGSTDILARMAGQAISTSLGQPVVVENRAGASGNIGMEAVARAAPDGYTLLFTTTNLTLNPEVLEKVPYDPVSSFSGVSMLAFAPMILITKPGFAGGSLQSLVKYGLSHPGQLNFSSSGAGGAPHLAGEMLKLRTGMKMTHVPYKGAAPAIADIVAGQVQMTFTTYVSASAMLHAHRVAALAVASSQRLPVLPDVPTVEQAGIKDFEIGTMFGLLAPKGTPAPVIQRLYEALKHSSADPAFRGKIVNLGASVIVDTPQEYDAYLRKDVAKWKQLIAQIGDISKN